MRRTLREIIKLNIALFVALFALAAISSKAEVITWANTNGGNWSDAANWIPSQVPGPNDVALIQSPFDLTVTVDVPASVGGLTLGGGAGLQTLNIESSMTNAGTMQLASGNVGMSRAELVNLPGALLDIQADVSIVMQSGDGPYLLVNQGTVRKSGGTGTTVIDATFDNSGTLDVQTGTLSLNGGGDGDGLFEAELGARLVFPANYSADSGAVLTGVGTTLLSGGTFTLNGSMTGLNTVLAGSSLAGTNGIISGVLTWTNGSIAFGSTLTLATDGLLTLAGVNGQEYDFFGTLTNAGTMQLASGNVGMSRAELVNLPGALLDIQADVSIVMQSGDGPYLIVNQGTVRKSGGTGTTTIDATFDNSGTLDVQTGTVSLDDGGTGGGMFNVTSGTMLAFGGGAYTVSEGGTITGGGTNEVTGGSLTMTGNMTVPNWVLTGGSLTMDGSMTLSNGVLAGASLGGSDLVLSGDWTWSNGSIAFGSTLTLAANGLLTLAGVNGQEYDFFGTLTNAGTMRLASGNIGMSRAELVNLPGALLDIQADVSIVMQSGDGPYLIVNQGTVRKSGGTGTTTIDATFDNSGTLDVQTGTVSLDGGQTLTGGRLNFGINNLTNFGIIKISGSAAITGTVSANLNNGYLPTAGNSFTVLTYGSKTGVFTNLTLPSNDVWQTNYSATAFTLTVTNLYPILIPEAIFAPGQSQPAQFLLQFVGDPNSVYTVIATTNVSSPVTNWTILGAAVYSSNSIFQFLDTQTTNYPGRFYRVLSP